MWPSWPCWRTLPTQSLPHPPPPQWSPSVLPHPLTSGGLRGNSRPHPLSQSQVALRRHLCHALSTGAPQALQGLSGATRHARLLSAWAAASRHSASWGHHLSKGLSAELPCQDTTAQRRMSRQDAHGRPPALWMNSPTCSPAAGTCWRRAQVAGRSKSPLRVSFTNVWPSMG